MAQSLYVRKFIWHKVYAAQSLYVTKFIITKFIHNKCNEVYNSKINKTPYASDAYPQKSHDSCSFNQTNLTLT
jgi:predicted KAP-like P-loop ATPase